MIYSVHPAFSKIPFFPVQSDEATMSDKDQAKFVKQQAAIKAAHSRRVLAQRAKADAKKDAGGKKK